MSKYVATDGAGERSGFSPIECLLGTDAAPLDSLSLYVLVREGLLLERVLGMVSSSLLFSSTNIIRRIIGSSGRSMMRQRKAGVLVRLNSHQSAIAFQYAKALEYALEVFGSQRAAEEWLQRPCRYLEGHVPLDMIEYWWGFQAVKEYLERIEAGVYH